MSKNLLGWHLLPSKDWERALRATQDYRTSRRAWSSLAAGRSICLMFFNSSLRTRTSMEMAAAQLGAHATTVTPGSGVWNMAFDDGAVMDGAEAEHVREAVGVLSRYYDAIGVRLFASMTNLEQDRTDRLLTRFAESSSVPVVSLESAFWHPCQELADAATIRERFGGDTRGRKLVLSWSYHPRGLPMAVPNSAVMMAARLGMEVTVARPEGYALDASVMGIARETAAASGGSVTETDNRADAFDGADIVYAKGWAGSAVYTNPDTEAKRRGELKEWRVTNDVMSLTRDAAFMHCLPVRRNVVVDDDVLDSGRAIHLLQAEYRLHAQKAILEMIWDLSKSSDGNN